MKMIGIGLIFFIIICIGIYVFIYNQDEKYIKKWASDNKYTVENCDMTLFDWGPFNYCSKGQEIFKVKVLTEDKRPKTFYFRFSGLFGTDIEEYND